MAQPNNASATDNDPQMLKIPVIGSRGVGKTSLVQQFVFCECDDDPTPTVQPNYFYPVVLFNEHIYNLLLIDAPCIPSFPRSTIQEWSTYRGYSLRTASAFILVFDVSSDESFQYVRGIRDQILEQNIDVPIVLVANKLDLLQTNGYIQGGGLGMNGGGGGSSGGKGNGTGNKRDVANHVKKHWKGTIFVECSARYNWRVLSVFKELMKVIDNRDAGHKPTAARAMQDALRRNRCNIM